MKRLLKRLVRPVWRLTLPLRARAVARLDQIVFHAAARVVIDRDPVPAIHANTAAHAAAVSAHVDALGPRFDALARQLDEATARYDEVTLVLDAVMAEQFRLQSQVESLRARLADALAPAGAGAGDGWGG